MGRYTFTGLLDGRPSSFSLDVGRTTALGTVATLNGPKGPTSIDLRPPDATGTLHGFSSSADGQYTVSFAPKGRQSQLSVDFQTGFGATASPPSHFKSSFARPPATLGPLTSGVYPLSSKLEVTGAGLPAGLADPNNPARKVTSTLTIADQSDGTKSARIDAPELGLGPIGMKLTQGPSGTWSGSWSGPLGESATGNVTPGNPPSFSLDVTPGNDEGRQWQLKRLSSEQPHFHRRQEAEPCDP
jgi:hypothetical protein